MEATEGFQGEERLKQRLGTETLLVHRFRTDIQVIVPSENLRDTLSCLKNDCGYDMLIDVTAVDYLEYPDAIDRFGVIYILLDTKTGARLQIKTMLNEPDLTLPTACTFWMAADWMEREVYDMFGIRFEGHPDLRRILLPDEFAAYPLRKDYPLRGRGERHNFPVITRAES